MRDDNRILDDLNPYASPRNIDPDVFDEEADGLKITVRKPEFYTKRDQRVIGFMSSLLGIGSVAVILVIWFLLRWLTSAIYHIPVSSIVPAVILVLLMPALHLFNRFFLTLFSKSFYAPIVSQYRERCPKTARPFIVMVRYRPYFFHEFTSPVDEKALGERLMTDSYDLGFLFFEGENLRFEGDGTSFTLPQRAILEKRPINEYYSYTGENFVKVRLRKARKHPFHTIEFRLRGGTSFSTFSKINTDMSDQIVLWSKNASLTDEY